MFSLNKKIRIITAIGILVVLLLPAFFSPSELPSTIKPKNNAPPATNPSLTDFWTNKAYFERSQYANPVLSTGAAPTLDEAAPMVPFPDTLPNMVYTYFRTHIDANGCTTCHDAIGLAISYDGGANYSSYNDGKAIFDVGSSTWDCREVIAPSVLKAPNGQWYMVYEGSSKGLPWENGCSSTYNTLGDVGLATSSDGKIWARVTPGNGGNLGLLLVHSTSSSSFECNNIGAPFIGWFNSQFYVFFHGNCGSFNFCYPAGPRCIDCNYFSQYLTGCVSGFGIRFDNSRNKIGMVHGADINALQSQVAGAAPIMDIGIGDRSWDSRVNGRPSVIQETDGYYYLIFEGAQYVFCTTLNRNSDPNEGNWGWGIARTLDINNGPWEKYEFNPIRQIFKLQYGCQFNTPYIFRVSGKTFVYDFHSGDAHVLLNGGDPYIHLYMSQSQCNSWHTPGIGYNDGDGWAQATKGYFGSGGYLCYGPYQVFASPGQYSQGIPAGDYAITWENMIDVPSSCCDKVLTEDINDYPTGLVTSSDIGRVNFVVPYQYQGFEQQFASIDGTGHKYEWRTYWQNNAYIRQHLVWIRQLVDSAQDSSLPRSYSQIDTTAPTGASVSSPATASTSGFTVSWTANDAGTGVWSYDLQRQDNGGPWIDWWKDTPGTFCCRGTVVTSALSPGDCSHTYGFRVRARDNSGNLGGYSSATSTYIACDYTLTANPTSVSMLAATTGWSTITVTPSYGFTATVELSASATPASITCWFSSVVITGGSGSQTLYCYGNIQGSYTVTVTGTSSGLARSTTVNFAVTSTNTVLSNYPGAPDWTVLSGNWNQLNGVIDGKGSYPELKSTRSFPADRTITMRAVSVTSGPNSWNTAWIRAKYVDDNNKVTVFLRTDRYVEMDYKQSGSTSYYVSAAQLPTGQTPSQWHTFTIIFSGINIKVQVDGTTYIDQPSAAFGTFGPANIVLTTSGSGSSNDAQFDNVQVNYVSPPSNRYTLTLQGKDYDGAQEETIKLTNQLAAQLPTTNSPQNAGVYASFTVDVTSFVVKGTNTLTFTHANWDCGVIDYTKNVQITDGNGTVIFSDPTERPLSCTQSITYSFTT